MLLDGGPAAPIAEDAPDILALLGDRNTLARQPPQFRIVESSSTADLAAYKRLRQQIFVHEQGLFAGHDHDDRDDDPRTIVLLARDRSGEIIGGVRLGPVDDCPDIGWWAGGRLVVSSDARGRHGVGPALVRAACARAEAEGVLRFEATVQARNAVLFRRLGWRAVRPVEVRGTPHILMRWPIDRLASHALSCKSDLGPLLAGAVGLGGNGFLGDDGAPVPGTDLIAACDAIVPAMVERDPEWAGWCAVLVNVNDLAAMGASPVGLLDALAARDPAHAATVLSGLRDAADAYGLPILGGHTQFGVPPALSVTALGRAARPIPGGGGRPGHRVRLTADLTGDWRPGYRGRQWDSTTHRTPAELRRLTELVARARPAAAKDVSMAGVAGTLGMLAEASGCGALLDVADLPRPDTACLGDWLTCFPGYAMLTTDTPDAPPLPASPATSAVCGELVAGQGVGLRWPDGEITNAITGSVTGMGPA